MRRSLATAILAASLVCIALVAIAVPAVALAGGGCHGASDGPPPGDEAASTVKIDGCTFFPTIARVPVGTTVTFLNAGVAPHNVTGVDRRWASEELTLGDRFQHRFTAAGIYPFACTLHPGMNGAVVVGGSGEAAAAAVMSDQAPPAPEPVVGAQPEPSVVAVAAGAAGGGLIGLMVGAFVFRRGRGETPDTIRTAAALDR